MHAPSRLASLSISISGWGRFGESTGHIFIGLFGEDDELVLEIDDRHKQPKVIAKLHKSLAADV